MTDHDAEREGLERELGDRYQLVRPLGRGAFSTVWLARERQLHRSVAIKVLHADRAWSDDERDRLLREARTIGQLSHPAIIPLLTFGETPHTVYLVMPFVTGESLADHLAREGRLDVHEVRRILIEIADALAYAHGEGVLHRDLKPENVLLERAGAVGDDVPRRVRLIDFGVATFPTRDRGVGAREETWGTPHFMAPEQMFGEPTLEPRTELYSFGILGYLLLGGRLPFDATRSTDRLIQQRAGPRVALAEAAPDAPRDLVELLDRCLAYEPAERPRRARDVRDALMRGAVQSADEPAISVLRQRLRPKRPPRRRAKAPHLPRVRPTPRLVLEEMIADVCFALRQLRINRRFAAAAIVTLAIGLGASTTIFGIANAVLLRPLPYPEPERVLVAYERTPGGEAWAISEPNYVDWRERARSFAALGAFSESSPSLTGLGDPVELEGAVVTYSFFAALGVSPVLGRTFTADEDTPSGQRRVAVISHAMWQNRFGGDPQVLERTMILDGIEHRIVGVMPRGFAFPDRTDVWTPLAPITNPDRGDRRLVAVGRLAGGVTPDQAAVELRAIAARLAAEYPAANADWSAQVRPVGEWHVAPPLRARVIALLVAVSVLLVMACVNVASLLLARAGAREREMAVRAALGAGRGRIVRQLLTESVVLSLVGATAGTLLALAMVPVIRRSGSAAVPQLADLGMDWRVLTFAVTASLATGLVFGLVPALRLGWGGGLRREHGEAFDVLRSGTRVADTGRVRAALIVGSVSLAMLLLVSAGLVATSFVKLMRVEIGFTPERVLTASVFTPPSRYDAMGTVLFHARLERRLAELPDVVAAGGVSIAPFSGAHTGMGWEVAARAPEHVGDDRNAGWRAVTPGFFEALAIPLLRGRTFDDRDRYDRSLVVVISQSLAREGWDGGSPIGERIALSNGSVRTIIGVVADIRNVELDSEPMPTVYFPHLQFPWRRMWLVLRTNGDPTALAASVRREVATLDPDLPVAQMQPLTQLISDVAAEPRLTMLVTSVFATAALLLAAVGLYGLVSFAVVQRTHELGVRLALGATPGDVTWLMLRQGVRLALLGVAIGAVVAYGAAGFLRSLLFETPPTDPATFASVAALLVLVAASASAIPAWRAAALDPVAAMRSE